MLTTLAGLFFFPWKCIRRDGHGSTNTGIKTTLELRSKVSESRCVRSLPNPNRSTTSFSPSIVLAMETGPPLPKRQMSAPTMFAFSWNIPLNSSATAATTKALGIPNSFRDYRLRLWKRWRRLHRRPKLHSRRLARLEVESMRPTNSPSCT